MITVTKDRPMWDEHLARRVNGELDADDRLDDQNQDNNAGHEFNNDFEHNDDNLDDDVLDALHKLDGVNVVRLQVLQESAQGPFMSLKRSFLVIIVHQHVLIIHVSLRRHHQQVIINSYTQESAERRVTLARCQHRFIFIFLSNSSQITSISSLT